ncbi:MAG: hypothetical protein M1819_003499 [Sarea resinae]|nr:MAG: hypothetical protein M1819_003499 [Sarea resinae]
MPESKIFEKLHAKWKHLRRPAEAPKEHGARATSSSEQGFQRQPEPDPSQDIGIQGQGERATRDAPTNADPVGSGVEAPKDDAPRDLWEVAFEKLDDNSKGILQKQQINTSGQPSSATDIVTQVVEQTKKKYDEYRKGSFKISRRHGKGEINVRDTAKSILSSALDFKGIIDAALKFDPTGHVSSAWAVVSLGLAMVKNDNDRLDATFEASEFLAQTLVFYARVEIEYRDSKLKDMAQLEDVIIDVYEAILDYTATVLEESNVGPMKRVLHGIVSMVDQPLTKLKSVIEQKANIVNNWTGLIGHQCQKEESRKIEAQADAILDQIEKVIVEILTMKKEALTKEEIEKLDWLSSARFSTRHNSSQENRTDNTGQWLLNSYEYKHWLNTGTYKFLWLNGVSGCGKTFLCSTAIENLRALCLKDSRNRLVFWYFQFDDEATRSIQNMIRSFIRQLSTLSLPNAVDRLWEEHKRCGSEPSPKELTQALDEIIASLGGEVYIAMDALDECPWEERKKLFSWIDILLHREGQRRKNVHILATSRREPDIASKLSSITTATVDIERSLEGDVRLYVQKSIEEDQKLSRWGVEIKSEIEEKLTATGERKCRTESQIRHALNNLPKSLEATYQRTLGDIDERDHETARLILIYLSSALRPLRLEELSGLVSLPHPESVLEICTSMLVTLVQDKTDEDTDEDKTMIIIKLAHFSVKEYLISKRSTAHLGHEWYQFSDMVAQATAAQTSLERLLETNDVDLSEKVVMSMPWLHYSSAFWYRHAKPVTNFITAFPDLMKQIDKIFSPTYSTSYCNWLRIYNCDDPLSAGLYPLDIDDFPKPLYYASFLGLQSSVSKLLEEGVEVRAGGELRNPIVAASIQGHTKIVKQLVHKFSQITNADIEMVAAGITTNVKDVMEILLSAWTLDYSDREGSTEFARAITKVLNAAAKNPNGTEITNLLLERQADILITEAVVKEAAQDQYGDSILTLLLDWGGNDIPITEEVVIAAASNSNTGTEILRLLLDRRGAEMQITEDVMVVAAQNWSGELIIRLLFDQQANDIPVTEEVIKAAASNRHNPINILTLLLDQRGKNISITAAVVKAAAGNYNYDATEILDLLLDERADIPITEEVVTEAVRNYQYGKEVVELLLDERGDIPITEEVVKEAARNYRQGKALIELFLDLRGAEVLITEDVMVAAAQSWSGEQIIRLLLDRQANNIPVTEEVVKAAASNCFAGTMILTLLLDRQGADLPVTEEVVKAALIHDCEGADPRIPEEVVEAFFTHECSAVDGPVVQWSKWSKWSKWSGPMVWSKGPGRTIWTIWTIWTICNFSEVRGKKGGGGSKHPEL